MVLEQRNGEGTIYVSMIIGRPGLDPAYSGTYADVGLTSFGVRLNVVLSPSCERKLI